MDRALKERVVGAVVLVIFIVLVVPVFLDGPADDAAVISETVTLPGQNGQERKRQTIVLERDRSEPVPTAATPSRDAADEAPAQPVELPPPPQTQPETVDPEPAPVQETPVAAAASEPDPEAEADNTPSEPAEPDRAAVQSATGMWAVQLGSFSNKQNAERLAAELRGQGYAAFLSQLQSNGRQLHRVRIGPQKDRSSAESTAARLSADGHAGQVVPHP